ncbi:MarR family winged helix-turn-helix transcriptional regulator [Lacrimispora sp. AGF001]|uniref:MarR family winged helix-turn-helix transcriptional regulator n=1 Tax=Lacrimispora sp. AGF001 TaxID=3401631 RepID=UPI003B436D9B
MKPMCHFGAEGSMGMSSPMHSVMTKYMKIMKMHRCILDEQGKQTGVFRSQHQILMMLSEHSNVSQKEIAKRLYVSTATIAVSVKKLEKGGYITRIVDKEDNRMNQLCLTEKGRDMVSKSREYFRNVEMKMFQGFSDEDLMNMGKVLDRIYDNLSQIPVEKDMAERDMAEREE